MNSDDVLVLLREEQVWSWGTTMWEGVVRKYETRKMEWLLYKQWWCRGSGLFGEEQLWYKQWWCRRSGLFREEQLWRGNGYVRGVGLEGWNSYGRSFWYINSDDVGGVVYSRRNCCEGGMAMWEGVVWKYMYETIIIYGKGSGCNGNSDDLMIKWEWSVQRGTVVKEE